MFSPRKRVCFRKKKALVKRRAPFTIQLTQTTGEARQPMTFGVDADSKYVGLSASTEKAELYASEVVLRTDVVDLVSSRRELRRGRRNRKTRYRAPRFNNRVHGRNKGWLAPSVENKINAHLSRVDAVLKLLPVAVGGFILVPELLVMTVSLLCGAIRPDTRQGTLCSVRRTR